MHQHVIQGIQGFDVETDADRDAPTEEMMRDDECIK